MQGKNCRKRKGNEASHRAVRGEGGEGQEERSDRRSGGGVEEDEQRSRGCLSPSRRGTSPRHTREEEETH